jgi:hypothetical protein
MDVFTLLLSVKGLPASGKLENLGGRVKEVNSLQRTHVSI